MSGRSQDGSDCGRRAFITGALLGAAGGSLAIPRLQIEIEAVAVL
jgi:hypothetical protein